MKSMMRILKSKFTGIYVTCTLCFFLLVPAISYAQCPTSVMGPPGPPVCDYDTWYCECMGGLTGDTSLGSVWLVATVPATAVDNKTVECDPCPPDSDGAATTGYPYQAGIEPTGNCDVSAAIGSTKPECPGDCSIPVPPTSIVRVPEPEEPKKDKKKKDNKSAAPQRCCRGAYVIQCKLGEHNTSGSGEELGYGEAEGNDKKSGSKKNAPQTGGSDDGSGSDSGGGSGSGSANRSGKRK